MGWHTCSDKKESYKYYYLNSAQVSCWQLKTLQAIRGMHFTSGTIILTEIHKTKQSLTKSLPKADGGNNKLLNRTDLKYALGG